MADETALATTPGRASRFLAGLLVSCFLAAFLAACAGLPALIGIRPGSVDKGDRVVTIFNVHTKETVRATYWQDGKFRRTELDRVDAIFRDWRTGDEINVDPALVDLLWGLHTELGSKEPIHLISGHRSPRTNDMLLRTRGGQAKKSLHIEGMAADVSFLTYLWRGCGTRLCPGIAGVLDTILALPRPSSILTRAVPGLGWGKTSPLL